MTHDPTPLALALSLGLAFLFGLAFEDFYASAPNRPGGVRTFPLLALLGLTANYVGGTSKTSDVAVYYAINGTLGAKSDPAEYEGDNLSSVGEADDGTTYGISRSTSTIRYECSVTWEPVASVRAASATVANPWTWQHFFAHVRAHESFALKDSALSETTVHKLREDGTSFVPQPSANDPNYVAYYNINLRTYLRGRA